MHVKILTPQCASKVAPTEADAVNAFCDRIVTLVRVAIANYLYETQYN